jgi:limonene-1,2-epoxide hydrolase
MNEGQITRRTTIQSAAAVGLNEAVSRTANAAAPSHPYVEAVRGLIADWKRKDIDAVLTRVADDIVWHYLVGLPPLVGKPAARNFLEKFGAPIAEVRWRIFDASVADDRVMVEGVDEYVTTAGGRVVVPYMGIMQFRDGLIHRWRDYADTALVAKLKNGEPVPDYVEALISRREI